MTNQTSRNNGEKTGKDKLGRFAEGNPGRPRGSRHKVTEAVSALLDGEAERLTRRAIEAALDGDMTALRLCLERIAPARRDTTIQFDLPAIKTVSDTAKAATAILDAVAQGDMTPGEASQVMDLVEACRRALETVDLEARIAALEQLQ